MNRPDATVMLNEATNPLAHCDVRETARVFLARGIQVVPIPIRSKNPGFDDWQDTRIAVDQVETEFAGKANIGIILGAPSNGLIDVDLDCAEARRIAPSLLPPTGMVHGRPGSPRSHHWYTVEDPGPVHRLKDPVNRETLIELRGTGGQTIAPPSRHPNGEALAWDESGEAGPATYSDLHRITKRIAAIALLARHWNSGSRHDSAMALSGFLLRHGLKVAGAEELLRLVAIASGDDEPQDRVRAVSDTAKKLAAGRPATGIPTLVGIVGQPVVAKVQEWLGLGQSAGPESAWEPPLALGVTDRPEFPTPCLPPWLRAWVEAESLVTQTPADLAGLLALSVVAAAIAKRVRVRVNESWSEPTNLYSVTVLAPGNRKSAVYSDVTWPVLEHEQSELARLAPEIAEGEARHRIATERLKEAAKSAAKADPGDPAEDEVALLARELAAMKVQARPRYIVDDCSPEKLATILQEQDGRVALMAPEGDIFDLIAGRYSQKMPNLGVFLRGHTGEDLRVDRVGRESEFVREATLTIGLTIQPATLQGFAATPEFEGRGLTARFLYSVPESPMGRREVNPPPMPPEVASQYRDQVRALLTLRPAADGSAHELRLDPDALQAFYDYQGWLEPKLAETGELGFMAGWAGKLLGATARIAGILHMARHIESQAPWEIPINLETISCALTIGDYLTAHARIAFGEMGANRELADARFLARWIRDRQVDRVTKKQLFDSNRGRFRRVKDLEPSLELLEDHGYVRVLPGPDRDGPGRPPSPTYEVNPLWLESV